MKVDYFGLTDTGKTREKNEDYLYNRACKLDKENDFRNDGRWLRHYPPQLLARHA